MPYIGNQAVVGDSANTFKLLDDISTFTLTFDGSSASVVSVANDTLTFANHRFVTGQRVTYTDGGGTVITGLTDGTAYFIIKVDQSTIKLATNASNAASSTAINLTGVGAGTSHTLNVAFDGVNTKFKATHTNGIKAGVSRAAQLSLSINGVIQQPTEAKPPTVGYGIEPDSTIVFSTAPVNTDKVFGSFIGEVAPSFDLTDNTVNNFTGDGSTSTFNLSKEIPSNNDVLVTLDGVTQYPSDTSTTRAYSVVGSSLIFVSAPADGVAIQVRMIGFAGSTAAEVTGFYGRTGNVALKSTDDIAFQNASAGIITASRFVGELVGVVTATDFFVSGIATFASDVGIAGTLTYEDVTNIDSVGIITARSNILVGSGITLSPDGDVFATGISTFSEGFAGDVLIDDKIVHRGDTDTAIRFPQANAIAFETAGNEGARIDSAGRLLVGTDTARQTRGGNSSFQPDIQLESAVAGFAVGKFNDSTGPARLVLQKARGSISSPTIVQDNDEIGSLTFSGWDGDTFTNTAQIRSEVEGTPGDDDMPGNLIFYTTSDGSSVSSERLRITSDGNIYTSGDQVRDDARLTITNSKVGVCTSLFLHNNNGSGTATKIAASKSIILSADNEANSGADTSYIAFETDNTEKVRITNSGVVNVKEGQIHLTKQGSSNFLKVGQNQNANNYAYIDLIGDDTYTGYGLRLIRNNSGASADSQLVHRGTGTLNIKTQEAGAIEFKTSDVTRMYIKANDHAVGFNTSVISGNANIKISDASSTAQIEINRSNTVSGGALGALNFTNHLGNSMASVIGQAMGSVAEGGLIFRTTTAAADNNPYGSDTPEAMRIHPTGQVGINTNSEFGATNNIKLMVNGEMALLNSAKGDTKIIQMGAYGKNVTMTTSALDVLRFHNFGSGSVEITVFRRDVGAPAGSSITKLYIAFHGSGNNITQATLAQEEKVIRGSIHAFTYSISENNTHATLTATGDNNGGEAQQLAFYCVHHGGNGRTISVL